MFEVLRERGVRPARVLEPTCGSGAFLRAGAATFPFAEVLGIEYQRERYGPELDALTRTQPRISVQYANAYEIDFGALPWRGNGPLLVAGNPPWITAAALGRGPAAGVQPPRSNPKGLRGLAARTGAANFDVAEFLILKLLRDLRAQPLHLALLIKESVARNVLSAVDRLGLGVAGAEVVRIDARAWFGVAVDACCLMLATAAGGTLHTPVAVRADFAAGARETFVPPLVKSRSTGDVIFRQGIKHDAADVFELRRIAGTWRNGYGESVDVEADHVYPLLKARELHSGAARAPMALIVPQQRLGAPTDPLATRAPRLWRYLQAHRERLAARRSSIYQNAPPFAIFGVGPYSFAPWKVAVAGFYAQPRFRVIGPQSSRCVVFGDTAYFVAFDDEAPARAFGAVCASPALAALIAQRVVRGKRPITKALLDGIDWAALGAAPPLLPGVAAEIRPSAANPA